MSSEGFVRDLLSQADININGSRAWDLRVHDARAYDRLVREGSIGFGEAFMDGWLDCERADIMAERAFRIDLAARAETRTALLEALKVRLFPFGSRQRSFEIGDKHYDIGNDLFQVILDK
jgi:cyclopropane-fatty-acyl-phospholipid synthase